MKNSRSIRRLCALLMAAAVWASALTVHGIASAQQTTPLQTQPAPPRTQTPRATDDPSADSDTVVSDPETTQSFRAASRDSLSDTQIEDLLQQRPELVVEIKSLVAEQQGSAALADSMTDAQLFRVIAASAEIRTGITNWLRARGYVLPEPRDRSSSIDRNEDNKRGRLTDPFSDPTSQNPSSNDLPQDALEEKLPLDRRNQIDPSDLQRSGNKSQNTKSQSYERPQQAKPAAQESPNITDAPTVLRKPAPYNLQSLRDLYTQVPQDTEKLKRFGSETFLKRDSAETSGDGFGQRNTPIDLPIGPDYILGPGDSIVVNLWGGVSQSLTRTVDREGKIVLPEAGSLVVMGLSLQHAQRVIESALQHQFRDVKVDVTIARLRTVRIYVVGDVQRPGAYDLSSLATPLNALYAAGGPTGVGSLRTIRHMRGSQLIREVDLYDFLLHGLRMDDERLESGDTLLVPPAGLQVAVYGAVKRPAVYEVKSDETLSTVLSDSGGATVAAALNHITVERIQPNRARETVTLEQPSNAPSDAVLKALSEFKVKDGDRIHVAPILPYSERAIYLQGHVARPGKYPYRDGMQLSEVLRSYQDLLPEPANAGEIVRLIAPDLHVETIQFDVAETLIGNSNFTLQPFDTVRIYGRYEVDPLHVTVRGEVLRPGSYAMSQGMTAAQLVKIAGGFKRDALLESADLTSYSVREGKKIVSQRAEIAIGEAMKDNGHASDVSLKPGDILTIHQISGWADIGASVNIKGEVTYPGSYGLQEGEHLSSVLRRTGGFRATAYADGAILVRTQVKQLEEKSREELIRQIETTSASARLAPSLGGQDQTQLLQAAAQQQTEVLQRLRSEPASGRLVIHINSDIDSWANTPADIELRSGDVLTIPKRPGFVLVSGQVYNASAITFVPNKTAGWYLQQAGGTNEVANNGEIVVVRANGTVIGKRSGGLFSAGVLSTRLDPGDVIVVPQKIIGGSLIWRNLLTVAQLTSSIAITAAVAGVL